jgi:hypothetical protein
MSKAAQASDVAGELAPPKKKPGACDISRFYYKNSNCASKRSSLSLDSVLVGLLMARFGSDQKLRKWVSAQAKVAQESGLDTTKSVSRAVQENAIRIIADPMLIGLLAPEEIADSERQAMMAPWLGQNAKKGAGAASRRL